jgi:hypothetical protein
MRLDILLALKGPSRARIPTEQGFGPVSSVGSSQPSLLQSRTTTRLYFWAARPWVLFGTKKFMTEPRERQKKRALFRLVSPA